MHTVIFENYSKKIKNRMILDDVSIRLDGGKIHGLTGRNGSGKTMLLRAACGLIRPTSGRVLIDGRELMKDFDFPPSCGAVIETPGFWNDYTGFDCLKMIAAIKKQISDETIRQWMERFGLDSSDACVYKKYSLGMKQKLALIQAFMEEPDLILLDEPTNALDQESVVQFKEVILAARDRGALVIVASHREDEIASLCDDIYHVEQGKVKKIEKDLQ